MSRVFMAINGDGVGTRVGEAIASNDHMALGKLSESIKQSHQAFEEWITSKGGEVITSSGDEGLYIVPQEALSELDQMREQYQQMSGHTLTVGLGRSMADASKALIYGKMNDKDQVVEYDPSIDDILSDDQVEEAEEIAAEAGEEPMPDEESDMSVPMSEDEEDISAEELDSDVQEDKPVSAENEVVPTESDYEDLDEEADSDQYDDENQAEMINNLVEQEDALDEEGELENEDQSEYSDDELSAMVEEDMMAEDEGAPLEEDMMAEDEEVPLEEDMMAEEYAESESPMSDVKGAIMQTLQIFRAHKQDLDLLATANPELHVGLIAMLENMINMAKQFQGDVEEMPVEEEALEEDLGDFPEADQDDSLEEEQQLIDEEMDEHNEIMHDEEPDEDSAFDNSPKGKKIEKK